jgi:putative NADPH-quinone reductase
MKKVLFINGGKQFAHSEGRYNATLHEAALGFMDRAGFDVKQTFIDGGYDVAEEVQKFLWADVIVWQMPGWWMGAPWTVKKYIDEVFTEGYGSLYANDGRTRSDSLAEVRQRWSVARQAIHDFRNLERPAASIRRPHRLLRSQGRGRCLLPVPQGQPVPGHDRACRLSWRWT